MTNHPYDCEKELSPIISMSKLVSVKIKREIWKAMICLPEDIVGRLPATLNDAIFSSY